MLLKIRKKKTPLDKKIVFKRILKVALVILALVVCYFAYTLVNNRVSNTFYYVVFDSDGGSRVDTATVQLDTPVTKPDDPTKEGYKFKYWTLNNVEYDFNTKVRNNVTLIAIWEVDDKKDTIKEEPKEEKKVETNS